jgi:alpha-aminoadipate carrier protein LysW
MPKVVCPSCGEDIILAHEEVLLYSTIHCEECGAILEIVSEDPPAVAAVDSTLDEEYDEDYDEDDDL